MNIPLDQHTLLYGVAGNPIGHSLSPAVHNAAFREMGINAVYLAFESLDIEGCIRGMRALSIKGMSITIPYKSKVIPLLDDLDRIAEDIGAVNTILNSNGRLTGYNTDAMGALIALREKVDIEGKVCGIIGAGGAAMAIGYILKMNGAEIVIANRSEKRGQELAGKLRCGYIKLNEVKDLDAGILINTTPLGMYPETGICPVPEQAVKEGMAVMDIIYNPLETRLLSLAKEKGCVIIDGLSMFINQAAEQFRLWTGQDAPADIMRKVANGRLKCLSL